jgi:hypothetical protein
VSRWSAERLRIGLAPDRVDLVRLGSWLGRGPARQLGADCAPALGQPPWQAALDALAAPLAELGVRGEAVLVVLSNHLVRYLVLPWQAELNGAAEVEQWARLHFERTYGVAAADWLIRSCDGGYGRPQVACAVDRQLVEQLGARLAGLGLRLASLQPLLMAAYNEARRQFQGRTAFAIVEAGRVCMSLLDADGWREIASRRTGTNAAETIAQELATLDTEVEAPQLEVLLVGERAPWPAHNAPPARLLGQREAQGRRTLAMCGAA